MWLKHSQYSTSWEQYSQYLAHNPLIVEELAKFAERQVFYFFGGLFGSNLKIQNKNVVASDDQFLHSPQENIWLWLCQSLEKAARSGDQISESVIVVRVRRL